MQWIILCPPGHIGTSFLGQWFLRYGPETSSIGIIQEITLHSNFEVTASEFNKLHKWLQCRLVWEVKVWKSLSCLTLCSPMDCSLPGCSVHGILQVRILEWVDFPSAGDLPNPAMEARSPAFLVDYLQSEPLLRMTAQNLELGFPHSSVVKEFACSAGDGAGAAGSIPGSGRSPVKGDGTPLQCSCLGNPMDRGAWLATAQRVAKSPTQLGD